MPNIFDPEFDDHRDQPGFTQQRAWIGRQAGAERIGASVWVMKPGEASYPYHFHFGDEEMIIVLEGEPSLRTPEGWRDLAKGEVVAFPIGEQSAHQLVNRTDTEVRFLALSTVNDVDVVIYPETDKVMTNFRRGKPDQFRGIYKKSEQVDYWDGEVAPD